MVTAVIGLEAKITALGTTLVLKAISQDQTGVLHTLKELPIGMARGPPLWCFLLAIPDDSPVRVIIRQLWPSLDIGSAVGLSKRLAELVQANAPPGDGQKTVRQRLPRAAVEAPCPRGVGRTGGLPRKGSYRPSSPWRSVRPSMICRVWGWAPRFLQRCPLGNRVI